MSYRPMTAWLFGKLPTHGDFIARGLTPQARDSLDQWLSDEMSQGREQFGDSLGERFDGAPPLLFAHCDAGVWEGGTLCPSVDSAGRRYPLLVARKVEDETQAAPAARACIDAVYRAFAERLDADSLWAAAGSVPLEAQRDEPTQGWWIDGAQEPQAVPIETWPRGLLCRILEPAGT